MCYFVHLKFVLFWPLCAFLLLCTARIEYTSIMYACVWYVQSVGMHIISAYTYFTFPGLFFLFPPLCFFLILCLSLLYYVVVFLKKGKKTLNVLKDSINFVHMGTVHVSH